MFLKTVVIISCTLTSLATGSESAIPGKPGIRRKLNRT